MCRHETLEAKKNVSGVTNCPINNVQQHSPSYFAYQTGASILSPACHNTHLDHFPPTDDYIPLMFSSALNLRSKSQELCELP